MQSVAHSLSSLPHLIVPPITTAPPTALSDANIPVCCAGVDLNLANPADPTDVRVFVDGILHPANQVSRYGSFLYIMGLQAGTEYPLNIALLNIFGTVWVNTTVKPLLGELVRIDSFILIQIDYFFLPSPPQAVPPPHK